MLRQRLWARVRAIALALASVGIPGAVPLLDADQSGAPTHIESSHDAARCAAHHDHAACVQWSRSPLGVAAVWRPVDQWAMERAAAGPPEQRPASRPSTYRLGPRAPPLLPA